MKYFFIAGERSGDLHGGNLIKAIKEENPDIEITGYGGDYMSEAGMSLISHYREISFMGFLEVVSNLRTIKRKIDQCKKDLLDQNPEVLILIDFPGFNLRMAEFAHKNGIKVAYYISPKIWAWKKSRIKKIRKYVDKMFVIFPFEVQFFRDLDYPVEFVGNPLVEFIKEYVPDKVDIPRDEFQHIISFLPGSRLQEVSASIKTITNLAQRNPEWLILVAGVDNIPIDIYHPLKDQKNVRVFIGKTYEILNFADASVTTSGTATLETALWNVPQLVCYKTSTISYHIAKAVVKIKYISLVNLIADDQVVQELIQNDYTTEKVESELKRLLENKEYRKQMLKNYQKIRKLLTDESSSKKVALSLQGWLSYKA